LLAATFVLPIALQLGSVGVLALMLTHSGPPRYCFRALLILAIASTTLDYQWGIPRLWQGWRVWIISSVEVAAALEAMCLITWPRGEGERSARRGWIASFGLFATGALYFGHPDPYPGSDPMAYYVRFGTTLYAIGVLVAALAWGWGRTILPGAMAHSGALLLWFTSNAATKPPWTQRHFYEADAARMAVHIGCVAWWWFTLSRSIGHAGACPAGPPESSR